MSWQSNFEPESFRFMAREIMILRNIINLEWLITSRLSCSIYLVFEYMKHDLSGLLACPDIKFSESQKFSLGNLSFRVELRLNSYIKYSSFVDLHLMNFGKILSFLMQHYQNHSYHMKVVLWRHLKIYK